jgi:hypothetical protein
MLSKRLYTIYLAALTVIILILSNPLEVRASAPGIGFYSPDSLPVGAKSLEPLIGKWWNFWVRHPASYQTNWPECLKGNDGVIGNNQSVVFLGDPASAVENNLNARNQKCEISSNQTIYLTVYAGGCSKGEYPDKPVPDLLKCAQDTNKVMKLMKVKVDDQDVSDKIIRQSTSQPFIFDLPQDNVYQMKAPLIGKHPTMGESYYLFFKPLPIGNHKIELEVIRDPLEANAPIEHDIANWDIQVRH